MVMPGVEFAIGCGNKDTKAPEEKPWITVKAVIPAMSVMSIQSRHRTPAASVQGVSIFQGPNLSAKKFGMIRPNAELPFMTASM